MFIPYDPNAQRATIISGSPDPRYDLSWLRIPEFFINEQPPCIAIRTNTSPELQVERRYIFGPDERVMTGCTSGSEPIATRPEDV